MQWAPQQDIPMGHHISNYHIPGMLPPSPGGFYPYIQNGPSYNHHYDLTYPLPSPSLNHSQLPLSPDFTSLPKSTSTPDSYPPTAYQLEPQYYHDITALSDSETSDHLMQIRDDYEYQFGLHIKRESPGLYNSPLSDMTRASTPNNDTPGSLHEHHMDGELATIDKDQPYAQLIHKALLQADGHTMILRDIYEWFEKNTDKASASETKGWQNSIRHNLSMNGAFQKVDQPHEESRKGFMWRLTPEAIREGVKSTTRYRSKQTQKRTNRAAQPQRQASGAKGGQAARRSATLRRSKRAHEFRSDPYTSRSVPITFNANFPTDPPIPQTPSPYYVSEVDFAYTPKHMHDEYPVPHIGHGFDFFPSTQSFSGAPMSHSMDHAFILDRSPSEPLFTNSPTPTLSTDEPRTPMGHGPWNEGAELGAAFTTEDLAFPEYAG
ncbi:hypothetical protein GQ44DRAFT_619550 [Phaeosphaeriaceae sp. PMI808]|nr:hypothetical protein GQ44DRAFT_619550 [Phaeosphaeriaceae sp. PMI808]